MLLELPAAGPMAPDSTQPIDLAASMQTRSPPASDCASSELTETHSALGAEGTAEAADSVLHIELEYASSDAAMAEAEGGGDTLPYAHEAPGCAWQDGITPEDSTFISPDMLLLIASSAGIGQEAPVEAPRRRRRRAQAARRKTTATTRGPYRQYTPQQIDRLFDLVIEEGHSVKEAAPMVGMNIRTAQHYVRMQPEANVNRRREYRRMKRDLANQDCPPPELVGDHAEWVVDQVCAERDGELGKEYLVKWLGYDESTWEPEGNLANASTLLAEFQKRSSGPEQCGPSKRPRSKSLPPNVG